MQARVHVCFVRVDVHGCPGERCHAGSQLELHVIEMRAKQHGRYRDDVGDDAVILRQRVLEVVVVGLELVLLQQHDPRAFGNLDAHPVQRFGLSDQLQDFLVEVHVELVVLWVPDNQRGLETRLSSHRKHPIQVQRKNPIGNEE